MSNPSQNDERKCCLPPAANSKCSASWMNIDVGQVLRSPTFYIGLGVFLLALTVRLTYLWQSYSGDTFGSPISDESTYGIPFADEVTYDMIARRLVWFGQMDEGFFRQSFFYPLWLAGVYSVAGKAIVMARVAGAILGALTCLLTWRVGEKLVGRWTGLLAGIMAGVYGPLVFYDTRLMPEVWAAFWSVALVLLLLETADARKLWPCIFLGLCGGLSIVTRPMFAPFFGVAVVWLAVSWARNKVRPRRVGAAVLLTAVAALAVTTAVSVANLRVTGHFGFLPANSGINLHIGNNPHRNQTILSRPGRGYHHMRNMYLEYSDPGIWNEQQFFYDRFTHYVKTDPVGFVKGLLAKTVEYVNSREIPNSLELYSFRPGSGILSALCWKVGGFGFPFGVLMPLAVIGFLSNWRRTGLLPPAFVLLFSAVIIMMHVNDRYRVPIVPLMTILAAGGLIAFLKMIGNRQWRRLTLAVGVITAMVLLGTLPGPFPLEKVNHQEEMYFQIAARWARQGRFERAIFWGSRAIELDPQHVGAHINMGDYYYQAGDNSQALDHYLTAMQLDPDNARTYFSMGVLRESWGDLDGAMEHYGKALELREYYPQAHRHLGRAQVSTGQLDQAIEHFRRALELAPKAQAVRNDLAAALAEKETAGNHDNDNTP